MLDTLLEMLRDGRVQDLVNDRSTPWQTLKVRYETPHVDRAWVQVGDNRLNLHRIHPCDKALLHPHPWPSAVYIFSGCYEMEMAWADSEDPDGDGYISTLHVGKVRLTGGSSYEMVDPNSWHSVRPIGSPSFSLMLTGKPWDTGHVHPGKGITHETMTPAELGALLAEFHRAG